MYQRARPSHGQDQSDGLYCWWWWWLKEAVSEAELETLDEHLCVPASHRQIVHRKPHSNGCWNTILSLEQQAIESELTGTMDAQCTIFIQTKCPWNA